MITKPYKYTPEELQAIIDKYFNSTPQNKYTVTGLALLVGSKQLLQEYQKRDAYKGMVKLAKLKVENSYEADLRARGRSGDIFALKNFGWKDKQEIDTKITGELSLTDILQHKKKE